MVALDWREAFAPSSWSNWALVLIGALGIRAALGSLKAISIQTGAAVNAERAWLVAELVPLYAKGDGNRWYRLFGDRLFQLSTEDYLRGEHLRHKLVVTNMGRTPAIVRSYEVKRLVTNRRGEMLTFDQPFQSLEASKNIEFSDDTIKLVHHDIGLDDKVFFKAVVVYQHVFSRTQFDKAECVYIFREKPPHLERVGTAVTLPTD